MSVDLISPPRVLRPGSPRVPTRLNRAERRRLVQCDRLAARLAELHRIRALLADAEVLVSAGWVQHVWYAILDDQGGQVRVRAQDIHLMRGAPVAGACLVGAIVQAGGGPSAVQSQLVQRSLDLTWHALREDEHRPVQWCPGPSARTAHVRDLTRWNDSPLRTASEVTGLLQSAQRTARVQGQLARVG